jgi:hypothetical protein
MIPASGARYEGLGMVRYQWGGCLTQWGQSLSSEIEGGWGDGKNGRRTTRMTIDAAILRGIVINSMGRGARRDLE